MGELLEQLGLNRAKEVLDQKIQQIQADEASNPDPFAWSDNWWTELNLGGILDLSEEDIKFVLDQLDIPPGSEEERRFRTGIRRKRALEIRRSGLSADGSRAYGLRVAEGQ